MYSLVALIVIYSTLGVILCWRLIKFGIRRIRYKKMGDEEKHEDFQRWRTGDNIEFQLNLNDSQIGYLYGLTDEFLMLEIMTTRGSNQVVKVEPFQVIENRTNEVRKDYVSLNKFSQNTKDTLSIIDKWSEEDFAFKNTKSLSELKDKHYINPIHERRV